MNQKQFLSAPLRKWLADNEGGVKRLMAAGLTESSIEKIRLNRCSDRFFLMYGPAIEKVTGISAGKLLIKTAKHELWGNNDKLPQIVSSEELVAEFRAAAETNPYDAGRIVRTEGPKNLNDFIAEHRKWGIVRIKNVLSAIAQLGQPVGSGEEVLEFTAKDVSHAGKPDEGKRSQRTVDSIISMLNSLANVADANIDRDSVPENAKINAAYAMARMLAKLGVSAATIRAFKEKRGGTDTTNLEHVLKLFGG